MTVLSLRFCARTFSSCGKRGPLFIAVRGPPTVAASPAAEHRPQTRRLSNCGSWAELLRGMWDLPRPGLEPMSPASAGRFSTTAPPGKPPLTIFNWIVCFLILCCMNSLYILDINPLSDIWFANIFSHSVVADFIHCKSFSLWCSTFVYFCFCVPCPRRQIQKKYREGWCQRGDCPCFLIGVLWFQVLHSNL